MPGSEPRETGPILPPSGPDAPVAVTGAGGYLGGRVTGALGADGRALVRAQVPWLPASSQMMCNLLDGADQITEALDGARFVVHLAGHNEIVARSEPDRAVKETVTMAENVARAAVSNGINRLVYVSTVHVYGDRLKPGAHIHEEVASAPLSAYARARRICEELLLSSGDLDVVVLRLTNAVGAPADPGVDRWTLVASDLCLQGVLDKVMTLRSSGMQSRDFITLDDAVRMVIGACDPSVVPAGVYNLCSGRPSTVRGLADLIQERITEICGWLPVLEAPEPEGPPEEPYVVDPSRLLGVGLQAEQPLRDGIDEIIDHCRKHETTLRRQRRGS